MKKTRIIMYVIVTIVITVFSNLFAQFFNTIANVSTYFSIPQMVRLHMELDMRLGAIPYITPFVIIIIYYLPLILALFKPSLRDISNKSKMKILNAPLVVPLIGTMGWFVNMIAVFLMFQNQGVKVTLGYFLRTSLNFMLFAILAFVIGYYITEMVARRFFIGKFFPDGNLSQYKGGLSLSFRKKLFIKFLATTVIPVNVFYLLFLNLLYRSENENLLYYVSFVAVLLIAVSGIVYILSAMSQKPAILIKKAMDKIMAGNYDIHIPVLSLDENGFLSEGINNMVVGLKEKEQIRNSLKELSEQLERKVDERTQELQVLNEELQSEIEERKQIEETLTESEEKYRSLVERANDGIVILQDGKVVFINTMMANILDYEVHEMLDNPFIDYVAPIEKAHLLEQYRRRQAGESVPHIYESALITKGGVVKPVELNSGLINFNGKTATLTFIRDITERKQAENELKERERKLSAIFNNAGVGIALIDRDARMTQVNGKWAEMFGYTPEEMVGKTMKDITMSDQLDLSKRYFQQLVNREIDYYQLEKTYLRKDGTFFHGDLSVTPICSESECTEGIIAMVTDITERKRASDEIKRQESLLHSLIDSIPDMIFYKDLEGTYIGCNPTYARLMGRPHEEIIGKNDYDFFTPEEAARYMEEDMHILQNKQMTQKEEWVVYPDGRRLLMDFLKTPYYGPRGETLGLVGIGRDITERKTIELALKESERRFREFTDLLPQTVYEMDREGYLTFINRAGSEFFGIHSDDVKNRKIIVADYFLPEERDVILHGFDNKLSGKHYEMAEEYTVRNHDGKMVPVVIYGNLVYREGAIAGSRGIILDISERKKMEDAIRESEEKYRKLVQDANSIILRMDKDGNITFFNEYAQKFFGYSESEILGKSIVGTIVPEIEYQGEAFRDLMREVCVNPKINELTESQNMLKNGDRVWISWTNKAIFDENGEVSEILCVGLDISERKKMEEELILKDRFLIGISRAVIELISNADFNAAVHNGFQIIGEAIDADRVYLFQNLNNESNEHCMSLLYIWISPYTTTYRNMEMNCIPYSRFNTSWYEILSNRQTIEGVVERMSDNERRVLGEQGIVSLLIVPVMIKEQFWGFIGIDDCRKERTWQKTQISTFFAFADTLGEAIARNETEKALRESQKRFHDIAEVSGDWIWELDEHGNYSYASPVVEKVLGYKPEEVIGSCYFEYYHPDERDMMKRMVMEYIERKEGIRNRIARNIHKDGHEVYIESCAIPYYDTDGHFMGFRGADRDISERIQIEAALKRSEERMKLALDAAEEGVWEWNSRTGENFYSDKMFTMLGYEPDKGNYHFEFFASLILPEDAKKMDIQNILSFKDKDTYAKEIRMQTKDGCYKYILSRGKCLERDENGNAVRVIGTHTDITELKRAEKEIRQIAALQKSILESARNIYILSLDRDENIISYNTAMKQIAKKLWGFDLEVGKRFSTYFEDMSQEQEMNFKEEIARVLKGESFSYIEAFEPTVFEGITYYIPTTNAEKAEFFLENIYSPIVTEEGSIIGLTIFAIDITQRIQSEIEIRKSNALQTSVLESMKNIAIYSIGLDYKLLSFNNSYREFLKKFSYGSEPTVGMDTIEYIKETDSGKRLIETYKKVFMGESISYVQELREAKLEDGNTYFLPPELTPFVASRVYLEGIYNPIITEEGKIIGATVVFMDITARIESENTLRLAKEEAEAATRSKSEFLANMSHEIRTPMNAIIGMTKLSLNQSISPKLREYLEIIESSSKSLLVLINDILDFSKIEAGKMDIESIEFNLSDILEQISDLFRTKAAEKDIELIIVANRDVPMALLGDPLRLGQVMINLVSNSVKFTEKGEIILRVECMKKTKSEATLHFKIQDSGIGIEKEKIHKLFESFTQADGSTTRKFGGTGLGLAICKSLVELMGGEIWAESEVGVGTTFHFKLHLMRQDETKERKKIVPSGITGMRVLVVDDNQAVRIMMNEILSSFSFQPFSVATGRVAINKLLEAKQKGEGFDLILMDWRLEGMDGVDTIREIKKIPELSGIPVIFMTAFGTDREIERIAGGIINAFLLKPIKPSALFDTIIGVFDRSHDEARWGDNMMVTRQNINKEALSGARVLLVEDNKINQQVALEILHNAEVSVDVANNGREGIAAIRNKSYDAVLMDIQMPEMDGFEATKIVRLVKEYQSLPIIAMTANAMKGDKEKCIAAGMNDYISKPIDIDQLYTVLKRWVNPVSQADKPIQKNKEARQIELPSRIEGIDMNNALARLGYNKALFVEILKDFYRDNLNFIQDIKDALKKKSGDAHRLAHTLKGVSGNIGAMALFEASKNLDDAIKTQDDENIAVFLKQTEECLLEVLQSVKTHFIHKIEHKKTSPSLANSKATMKILKPKLSEIYRLCKSNDIEAEEVFGTIKDMETEGEMVEFIRSLELALGSYNFKESLDIIEKFAKKHRFKL